MGCTEIPIILADEKIPVPLLDPNVIIAKAAVKFAKADIKKEKHNQFVDKAIFDG